MEKVYNFIHGKFGKKVLKGEYRELWVRSMYCIVMVLGLLLMAILLEIWSWVVEYIDYVVYGISY